MIAIKKLNNGGDKTVEKMIENSSLLGVDLIELFWSKKRDDMAQVVGFMIPVVNSSDTLLNDDISSVTWIDGTLHFYPDMKGVCWGYVYDTPQNRELLYYSFIDDWFRIADKKVREEIKKEAESRDIATDAVSKTEILIKKSTREIAAEDHAKNLEKKLQEMKDKMNAVQKELAIAKGEKIEYIDKRLKGVKVPNRDEILEEKINVN
jgi:hypothetical protein